MFLSKKNSSSPVSTSPRLLEANSAVPQSWLLAKKKKRSLTILQLWQTQKPAISRCLGLWTSSREEALLSHARSLSSPALSITVAAVDSWPHTTPLQNRSGPLVNCHLFVYEFPKSVTAPPCSRPITDLMTHFSFSFSEPMSVADCLEEPFSSSSPLSFLCFYATLIQPSKVWLWPVNDSSGCEYEGTSQMKLFTAVRENTESVADSSAQISSSNQRKELVSVNLIWADSALPLPRSPPLVPSVSLSLIWHLR